MFELVDLLLKQEQIIFVNRTQIWLLLIMSNTNYESTKTQTN